MIWIQVRDVHAEHARLAAAGVPILRGPAREPWGLTEMWIQDPDGIQMGLAGFPADHPLAATRDRRHRQSDDPYAADPCVAIGWTACINMPVRRPGAPGPVHAMVWLKHRRLARSRRRAACWCLLAIRSSRRSGRRGRA